LETIPAKVPYIFADPQKTMVWQESAARDYFKVGIVWAGGMLHKKDKNRSIGLKQFLPLSRIANVRLYGLQKGAASEQAAGLSGYFRIENYGEQFKDFGDTAGFIDNLDLVISVDTAVAHLAGAMGKPAWVLLPFAADWRWMLHREDSPWYPTMRLFRQKHRDCWDEVIRWVARELRKWIFEWTACLTSIDENCL
jgi:hypothetical protein